MTYRTEFPDFPEADLPPIPASWSDLSWHNDAAPFFLIDDSLGIWIDYADPAMSDFGPTAEERGARFMLCPMKDGEHVEQSEVLFESNEWAEVLAFIAQRGA